MWQKAFRMISRKEFPGYEGVSILFHETLSMTAETSFILSACSWVSKSALSREPSNVFLSLKFIWPSYSATFTHTGDSSERSKLMEEKYGTKEGIPQLIIAGSSIDDIVMIVCYQSFLTLEKGGSISAMTFLNIPISIASGIAVGVLLGFLLSLLLKRANIGVVWSFILLLSLSCGLTYLEEVVSPYFGFSSLLSIITLALVLHKRNPEQASNLKSAANQVWALAEVFLFVLVGSSIRMDYALRYFLPAFLLLLCSLLCRSIAVSSCLIRTNFDLKERSFVILSYLPKATVQAAIGGGLLDYGNSLLSQGASNAASVIAAGEIVLSVSVLSILLSAPLSAILMNALYPKLLKKEE